MHSEGYCLPAVAQVLVVLQSIDLYTPLQDGASPLFIASQEGQSEVVDVLVKNGVDINQPRNVGRGLTYGTLILYVHHLFLSHRLVQHLCT